MVRVLEGPGASIARDRKNRHRRQFIEGPMMLRQLRFRRCFEGHRGERKPIISESTAHFASTTLIDLDSQECVGGTHGARI